MGQSSTVTRSAAVDLGAASGRVIVGSLTDQSISLEEVARFETPTLRDPVLTLQCWDIERILASSVAGIEAACASETVHSVGVDSWAVDFVLLDEQRELLAPPVCYREAHTSGMMESLFARIPRREIYERTGIQFQPFNTIYQVAGLAARHPDILNAAHRMLMIPDYLHLRLSGVAANEYTNASTTQLLNLDGCWDGQLMQAAGVKPGLAAAPIAPGSILGEGKFAGQAVQVVAPATHDTASAVVGTPLESSSEVFLSSGTWSLMGFESAEPFVSAQALEWNVTNEGGVERRFRVLKNIMGLWPLQCFCRERAIGSLDALLAEAGSATPWRSIVHVDDAVFLNPASMAEAISGSCRHSGQPEPETAAQFARCILDSLALCYGRAKQQLEQLRGASLSCIRVVGGGSRNRLLNQLCADACGVPVFAGPVEASALGNLVVQWIGLGALRSVREARELIRAAFPSQQFTPSRSVPAEIWQRFDQLAQRRSPEEVACP